jgi:hypothetical protein
MRESQDDQSKKQGRRTPEGYVKNAANQERDSDRNLHATLAFARNSTRHNRTYGRSNSSRRKKNADSARGAFADRKDSLSKNGQQREYAAAESPRRFDEQVRQDARAILDVSDPLDGLGYP